MNKKAVCVILNNIKCMYNFFLPVFSTDRFRQLPFPSSASHFQVTVYLLFLAVYKNNVIKEHNIYLTF